MPAKKPSFRPLAVGHSFGAPKDLEGRLNEASILLKRGRLREARDKLLSLEPRYRDHQATLNLLLDIYARLPDMESYASTAEQLLKLTPDDAELMLAVAAAYIEIARPALARRMLLKFTTRFPNHPEMNHAQQMREQLETGLRTELTRLGMPEDDFDLVVLHEEVQQYLAKNDWDQAFATGKRLLKRYPKFVPVRNNLSQAAYVEGDLKQAIALAEEALAIDPDNVHALANLSRYHLYYGRRDEARRLADRALESRTDSPDLYLKQAEALAYLGDDAGVLQLFALAEKSHRLGTPPTGEAMFCHLAAYASLRQGKEREARRLWERAQRLLPAYTLPGENLAELRKPVSERHAPFLADSSGLISAKVIQALQQESQRATRRGGDDQKAVAASVRKVFARYPYLPTMVPLLLEVGGPGSRELAMFLIQFAALPELYAAARDFALGVRGPDMLRLEAANLASSAGLLGRKVKLWSNGAFEEVMLANYEISGEPEKSMHSPKVERLVREAVERFNRNDFAGGEQLLNQALALEPDAPDIQNNLAVALLQRGHEAEAEELVRQIHARHPDYLFARVAVAQMHIRDGRADQAHDLLDPLLERRRFHTSEFGALAMAMISLLLLEKELDGARSWLELWRQADPENPELSYWKSQIAAAKPRALRGRWR